jgi:hypothetical protein
MGLFGSAFDNASDCGPGLVCHAGECTDPCVVALPTAGQPCTLSLECAPGARCDTQVADAPVCVALIADGVACTGHDQCVSGHCPDGRCRPQLTEGQACTDNLRCADGLSCEDGVCRSSTAALCQGVLFELLD